MKNQNKGFTLIELMIVMIIMAILIVAGIGSFTASQKKGRDTKRKGDLRNVQAALELYANDRSVYPTGDATNRTIKGCGSTYTDACSWGGVFGYASGTLYMSLLPSDPRPGQRYYYVSNGSQYQLYAYLENDKDSDINSTVVAKGLNCASSGTIICNYGVSSTNIQP